MFKMMAFGDEATPSMKLLWALQVINYLVLVPTLACIDAAWLKTKLICQV